MTLAGLSADFKFGPSGADCWMGEFMYVLGPCSALQRTLL